MELLCPSHHAERHFSEIIVNILHNARDAMNGKGNIHVEASGGRFSIDIMIVDDGPGMSQELLDQVFGPISRLKKKGLARAAIVKHNVEIYGGKLMVESQLGAGTNSSYIAARALIKLEKPVMKDLYPLCSSLMMRRICFT